MAARSKTHSDGQDATTAAVLLHDTHVTSSYPQRISEMDIPISTSGDMPRWFPRQLALIFVVAFSTSPFKSSLKVQTPTAADRWGPCSRSLMYVSHTNLYPDFNIQNTFIFTDHVYYFLH